MRQLVVLSLSCVLLLGLFTGCEESRRRAPSAGAGLSSSAEMGRCMRLLQKKKTQDGIECLEVFKSRHRSDDVAARADLLIAETQFRKKDYLLAAESFQEFVRQHPYHEKVPYAYFRAGTAYMNDVPKSIDRDQDNLKLAAKNFEIVMNYYPDTRYARIAEREYAKVKRIEAEKHYYVARFYYKYREYLASILRFQTIVDQYAKSGYAEKSYYYLIQALLKTDQPEVAREVFLKFEQVFPASKLVKSARSQLLKV